jgi:hypothetical protein
MATAVATRKRIERLEERLRAVPPADPFEPGSAAGYLWLNPVKHPPRPGVPEVADERRGDEARAVVVVPVDRVGMRIGRTRRRLRREFRALPAATRREILRGYKDKGKELDFEGSAAIDIYLYGDPEISEIEAATLEGALYRVVTEGGDGEYLVMQPGEEPMRIRVENPYIDVFTNGEWLREYRVE